MKKAVNDSKLIALLTVTVLAGCGGGSSGTSATGSNETPVTQTTKDVAALTWNAPATRVNGEGLAMGELDGYVILYGQDANNLDRQITITEASTMSYTVSNLSRGEWYFAIQVVDTQGLISAPSEIVAKSI